MGDSVHGRALARQPVNAHQTLRGVAVISVPVSRAPQRAADLVGDECDVGRAAVGALDRRQ